VFAPVEAVGVTFPDMNRRLEAAVLAGVLLTARAARAGTVTVANTNDAGAGSLRDTVAAANTGDTVLFDASLLDKTITLTTGAIAITKNLTIDGGANRVSISGNGASRVFTVDGPTVTLASLTLRDGLDASVGGGCLLVNSGIVTLQSDTVTECVAANGGGGIRSSGTLTITSSTISGTRTAGWGGGIDNVYGGVLALTNSTVTGNVAFNGGGIDNYGTGSVVTLTSSTIAENAASGSGGGLHLDGTAAGATLTATILSNRAATGPDCDGTVASTGYVYVRSTVGCAVTGGTGNVLGGTAEIGPLQSNGGKTRTHAVGTPLVDAIPTAACAALVDQRGLTRPQTGDPSNFAGQNAHPNYCDIGAYEAARPIPVTNTGDAGTSGTCTLRQALAAANTNSQSGAACYPGFLSGDVPDRILAPSGTITLTQGALVASEGVMIEGRGAQATVISGGGVSGVLQITNTGSLVDTYVISRLTLADGKADYGGGLYATPGADDTLAIDRVLFRGDKAKYTGGSIWTSYDRSVEISGSAFTNPVTWGAQLSAGLMVANVPLTEIVNTTVAKTGADWSIFVFADVPNANVKLRIVSSTIVGADGTGVVSGSFWAPPAIATVEPFGSIFAGHTQNNFGSFNYAGVVASKGDNVSSDASGGLAASGDQESTDPLVGVLAYNGGQTPTYDLKPGSPALDKIALPSQRVSVDQRGLPRSLALADVGAVERVVGGDVDGNGSVNVADVFYLINFLFAGGPVPVGEADMNGDGAINVSDVFYLINRLFAGGPAPI
jgi:hypothetical protein